MVALKKHILGDKNNLYAKIQNRKMWEQMECGSQQELACWDLFLVGVGTPTQDLELVRSALYS